MANDCAAATFTVATPTPLPLDATFDGGRLTSDGGLPWLAQADEALGLCAAFARLIPEWRRGAVRHSLEALVRQRVFQIARAYQDQNDAQTLRSDPWLKLVRGRLPDSDSDLASQPTLSRLDNATDLRTCYRLGLALLDVYRQQREQDGVPQRSLLDFDSPDDRTHGDQEGSAYHGYFGQHMYHPLLGLDGGTGQLITAVLRRRVRALRSRWPRVSIELRADSGFALPAVYDFCEHGTGIARRCVARRQELRRRPA